MPVVAQKVILNFYHDLGQGILEQIYDTYEELHQNGDVNHVEDLTKQH
jgi:hypothetical protein